MARNSISWRYTPLSFFAGLLIAGQAGAEASDLSDLPIGPNLVLAPYGQFHFAYQTVDDGGATTTNIVDVTNANSRIGFYLKSVDDNSPLSFHFETGLGFRPSQKTSQTNTPEFWNWQRTDLRKVQLILESSVGTFKLGQGSMPLDGAAESDLGGTVVAAKSTIPEGSGAFQFRTSAGALSSVTIGNAFDNFDGDRRMRLRYDTPGFSGFSLAVAYGSEVLKSSDPNHYYDVALRYQASFEGIEVKGSIGSGYVDTPTGTTRTSAGSVSLYDERTGLNLSIAGGQDASGLGRYVYLKAGWNAELFSVGTTKFVSELFRGDDYLTNNSRSDMWSAAVIQDFDDLNLETYAGYRVFSYADASPTNYQDASVLHIGARWRF